MPPDGLDLLRRPLVRSLATLCCVSAEWQPPAALCPHPALLVRAVSKHCAPCFTRLNSSPQGRRRASSQRVEAGKAWMGAHLTSPLGSLPPGCALPALQQRRAQTRQQIRPEPAAPMRGLDKIDIVSRGAQTAWQRPGAGSGSGGGAAAAGQRRWPRRRQRAVRGTKPQLDFTCGGCPALATPSETGGFSSTMPAADTSVGACRAAGPGALSAPPSCAA